MDNNKLHKNTKKKRNIFFGLFRLSSISSLSSQLRLMRTSASIRLTSLGGLSVLCVCVYSRLRRSSPTSTKPVVIGVWRRETPMEIRIYARAQNSALYKINESRLARPSLMVGPSWYRGPHFSPFFSVSNARERGGRGGLVLISMIYVGTARASCTIVLYLLCLYAFSLVSSLNKYKYINESSKKRGANNNNNNKYLVWLHLYQ